MSQWFHHVSWFDSDAQVQDVLQCGGITMPHEETKMSKMTKSQCHKMLGKTQQNVTLYHLVSSCNHHVSSCIIMYHHVSSCILDILVSECMLWAVAMSCHFRTVLIWHTSCSSRQGQLALGHCWSAPVGFQSTACHPLRVSLTVRVCVCECETQLI